MSTANSKQPPTNNGNGSKQLDDISKHLVSSEKAMNAMQSKFGAVNGLQGELKDFKKSVTDELTTLSTASNMVDAQVSVMKDEITALKRQIVPLNNNLPGRINELTTLAENNTQEIKALKKQVDELTQAVNKGLPANVTHKDYLKILSIILLLVIGFMLYNQHETNGRLNRLSSQIDKAPENFVDYLWRVQQQQQSGNGNKAGQPPASTKTKNQKNRAD
jgi:septal ring factor EnvC (AmiA/AmiB activator)